MLPAVRFLPQPMKAALRKGFVNATELADHLVTQGAPFREAHAVVGRLVAHCLDKGVALDDLDLEELRQL